MGALRRVCGEMRWLEGGEVGDNRAAEGSYFEEWRQRGLCVRRHPGQGQSANWQRRDAYRVARGEHIAREVVGVTVAYLIT